MLEDVSSTITPLALVITINFFSNSVGKNVTSFSFAFFGLLD